ncbi:MAG TPA: hypothetical protein VH560_02155 [Polyangia bacterium]|nr:hypothetical protein [Polyangia bacterium]
MSFVRRCLSCGAALAVVVLVGCGGNSGKSTGGTAGASGTAGAGSAGAGGGSAGASVGNGGAGGGGQTGTAGAGGAIGATAGAGGQAGASTPDAAIDAGSADAGTDAPTGTGCTGTGTLCWDFEEGKLPTGWTPYRNEYATGSLLVDNTRPHHGTYSLHAKDFSGGTETAQGGPKHTMQFSLPTGFGPTLWGRAYVYMTPATPMSHAGFFNARYQPVGSTTTPIDTLDWYEVATSGGKYVSIWHPPEPPGTPEAVQISDTAGVVDDWVCVEWLFDAQNGTAAQAASPRVWLNGVELAWPTKEISPTGVAAPTQDKASSFTVLESGVYMYQGLTKVTNWWIDDLAVGPQRIGCN